MLDNRPVMNSPALPDATQIEADVSRALAEDLGSGDATASLLPDRPGQAFVLCRESAVLAGSAWFEACFRALDPALDILWLAGDGDRVTAGTVLCTLRGSTRALVSAERCALNFLQTLSGTATVTADYVAAVAGTRARILDTRKTLPGLRHAQKYAVRCGGGHNHRMGLYDAVMLKENHILAAGSITSAVAAARQRYPALPVIVEVETLEELGEALATRPERILIDDFSVEDMRRAVAIAAGRVPLEVSGGVSLERVREYADTGIDCISIGALTKHVRAVDLSMRLGEPPAGSG